MFVSFPKISGFHNVRKEIAAFNDNGELTKETYRGKIKLHGTNSGVQIRKTSVSAQSRERVIVVGDDNMGFAGWVDNNLEYFEKFQDRILEGDQAVAITIFGEWCGRGIMKGTAISAIDRKIFAVFAIQFGESDDLDSIMFTEPDVIRLMMPINDDIYVLPWATNAISVDFMDNTNMEDNVSIMNKIVESVEHQDPWVKEVFGVNGIGEGVVFVPHNENGFCERWRYSKMAFKAKGDKHAQVARKEQIEGIHLNDEDERNVIQWCKTNGINEFNYEFS